MAKETRTGGVNENPHELYLVGQWTNFGHIFSPSDFRGQICYDHGEADRMAHRMKILPENNGVPIITMKVVRTHTLKIEKEEESTPVNA